MGLGEEGPLVSSKAQSGALITGSRGSGSRALASPYRQSGELRESRGREPRPTRRRVPTRLIRLAAGQMRRFDEAL